VKEIGLIIDINQSSASDEGRVRKSVLDFYLPLFRILKLYKNVNFSLNVPLSTLELWDKYGHTELISTIKDLYQNDKVEIVMSSPYGFSLSNVPNSIIENSIMLNEYGTGYYLGSRKGFDGESSIMLRDSNGFLPYDFFASEDMIKILGDYGYKWVVLKNEDLLDTVSNVFEIENTGVIGINIVDGKELFSNITNLNNMLSDTDVLVGESFGKKDKIKEFFNKISGNGSFKTIFIKLGDFDYFENEGLDYKDIVNTIELLLEGAISYDYLIKSVGDVVKSKNRPESFNLEQIDKSYHLFSSYEFKSKKIYDTFNLLSNIMTEETSHYKDNSTKDDFDTIRLWNDDDLTGLNDSNIHQYSSILVCFNKILSLLMYLDKYYVNGEAGDGKIFHDNISKYLNYIQGVLITLPNTLLREKMSNILYQLLE